MARSAAVHVPADDELADIEAWYRRRLAEPAVFPWRDLEPVRIGPTWQTETVNGVERWLLPERTLGWTYLAWCGRWLQLNRGEPWRFTLEQARFGLWWYATDESGRFLFRDGVFQRLKGHGKDPMGGCLCSFELVGPCRVGDMTAGQPVGVAVAAPWVQTAAVSLEQTKNTMRLLPGLYTDEAKQRFGVQVGKETVYARNGEAFMQAVTSSPATLEGARATFVLPNETQHWDASNNGHEMAAVIERNATKSPDGSARTLRITNAYEPGQDSVAEHDREAWEAAQAGTAVDTGLLYDSLEAPPSAKLSAEDAPAVVEAIRGDSVWLDTKRIVASILDVRNPPSRSRRFWYNQIVAAEDAWLEPKSWDALAARESLDDGERITAFFDGSKNDDATGLVACRVRDGKLFQLGVQVQPPGWDARVDGPWQVDRERADAWVVDMFGRFEVQAFWADPSDTRDDETGERFWEATIDAWHRRYSKRLTLWATKTGDRQHSVAWDMRSTSHQEQFTYAAMRFVSDVESQALAHDGSEALRGHIRNARRRPNRWGVTLGKEHRESRRKVDLAVCAVGARMLWRLVLLAPGKERTNQAFFR